MKVKTIKKHILEIESQTLKERIIESFLDNITTASKDSLEDLQLYTEAFADVLSHVSEDNWSQVFSKGYTTMALPSEEMAFVTEHFHKIEKEDPKAQEELVIEVTQDGLVSHRIFEHSMDF